MVYLVMLIERRRDYQFATQARTLAVLSRLGQPQSLNSGDERSHVYDLRGGFNAKEDGIESIDQQGSK